MTTASGPSPPRGDLLRIRRQLASSNPELYRQLALYLQVLRQILPHSVDQACFHLATQVQPGRYTALSEARRRHLHERLSALVSRCTTLLTVEQLAFLAGQFAREQALRADRFLGDLQPTRDRHPASNQEGAGEGPGRDQGAAPSPQTGWPSWPQQGSVHLGLDLPIEGSWLGWGGEPGFGVDASAAADPEDPEALPPELAGNEWAQTDQESTASDLVGLFSALAAAAGLDTGIRGLELPSEPGMVDFTAHAAAEDGVNGEGTSAAGNGSSSRGEDGAEVGFPFRLQGLGLDPASLERSLRSPFGEHDPGALYRPPAEGGLLPRNPMALLAWLEGIEQALERQLRDLSHAVNQELMQCGVLRILLPLNLLDAVLKGQIEVQSPHPNLLQLPLPLPTAPTGRGIRAHAMLLRRADLELEQPRLRTVRSRLQHLRQESRRMAQLYHRLQRRIQAQEAEALWLQDIRSMRPGPDPLS
jgi:hypothetical protein